MKHIAKIARVFSPRFINGEFQIQFALLKPVKIESTAEFEEIKSVLDKLNLSKIEYASNAVTDEGVEYNLTAMEEMNLENIVEMEVDDINKEKRPDGACGCSSCFAFTLVGKDKRVKKIVQKQNKASSVTNSNIAGCINFFVSYVSACTGM
ncbi:hypothetical protein O6P43_032071 [Quillaja saponaria]|uniref:Uncharacterized protein n=1 Tax=Quillaja saponaria TaxID=32244 RepID=A0AAD7PA18_QUISA|nr:hypothetical protein O6P43_032071 [Quillaja saponaria]